MQSSHTLPLAVRALATSTLVLAMAGTPALAAVLIFEPYAPNGTSIDPAYGDRVISTNQAGFQYGAAFGFTPNIEVDYISFLAPGYGLSEGFPPSLWEIGYAGLVNVLYGFGITEIRFTAEPGWLVALHAFDMGAQSQDLSINRVEVLDQNGHPLFGISDPIITASSTGKTSFSFEAPILASSLTIRFDTSNLEGFADYIAIDNIAFSQFVPSPAGITPWLAAIMLCAARRR